jgi:catechol 2,3-dioxygenase-like lactoylglutathione lyase family enzyme
MFGDNLRGLQHIGIPVINLDRTRAFYARLGFSEVMYRELPGTGEAIRCTMQERSGLVLEFYQLVGPDWVEVSNRGHGHIDHIALDVADIQTAWKTVRSEGLMPLEPAPVFLPFWEKGVYYFNILGPDGERIEFNQRLV